MTEWIYLQRKENCTFSPMVQVIGKVLSYSAGNKSYTKEAMGEFAVTFVDGSLTWYASKENAERIRKENTEYIIKNPLHATKIKERFFREIEPFIDFSNRLQDKDFAKLSNEELWKLYDRYAALYEKSYIWSEPLFWVIKENMSDYLEEYLNGISKDKFKVSHYLSILTSPVEKSFVKEEEIALLKIAENVQKDEEKIELFKKNIAFNYIPFELKKEIEGHTEQFKWIPYDYGVMIWDNNHFMESLREIVILKDAKFELRKINEYYANIKKEKNALIKKLKIDKKHQKIFDAMAIGSFIMDYKKGVYTKSHYQIISLLDEIGKRLNLGRIDVQFLMIDEIRQGLLRKKLFAKEIPEQRRNLSLYYVRNKGNIYFATQSEAIKFVSKTSSQCIGQEEEKISGKTGCIGVYSGKVRVIIDGRQIGKVEKGEVLVAIMTSPDFTMGIRKAGAIVTDEGGITCHAAIVSRELGIPCLIGTKHATKILKDGDMVEVNATMGFVRKI